MKKGDKIIAIQDWADPELPDPEPKKRINAGDKGTIVRIYDEKHKIRRVGVRWQKYDSWKHHCGLDKDECKKGYGWNVPTKILMELHKLTKEQIKIIKFAGGVL